MDTNFGKLKATLSEPELNKIDALVEAINRNIKPSIQLTADDVHIRCMYIVSEEVNSYGGKFPLDELYRIKELIVDSPVLIGHKKDQLPIGRNFLAEVVEKDNMHWVKSYFYWMKSADNAEDLQQNIDGGVIKECSIGFTFLTPQCSICDEDIRTCRHEPFNMYLKDNVSQACFFSYTEIDKVLETSLVYRGAVPNTSISNDLHRQKDTNIEHKSIVIDSLDELNNQLTYLITPMYHGLDVNLTTTGKKLEIKSFDNLTVPKHLIKKYFKEFPKNLNEHFGLLVGYRGKERCSKQELEKFLLGENSLVRRIELRLFPTDNLLKTNFKNIKLMRYKLAHKHEIQALLHSIMTKDGVRIWESNNLPTRHLGYSYLPTQNNQVSKTQNVSEYVFGYDNQIANLMICQNGKKVNYTIRNFNSAAFLTGKKFMTEISNIDDIQSTRTKYNSGAVVSFKELQDSLQIELDHKTMQKIILQPIRLHNIDRYLLYKSD